MEAEDLQRLTEWARWEFSRRIALSPGIKLIVLDRTVKAVVLGFGGIVLLIGVRSGFIATLAMQVQRQLNLSPGSHLWLRLVNDVMQRFGSLSGLAQVSLAVAAILYGVLEAVEAIGLLRRRRWAEYLVLLATAAFIPLEIDELARHPTVFKGAAFGINVAIVAYLIWRKRLFLDRPPASAPRSATVPASTA